MYNFLYLWLDFEKKERFNAGNTVLQQALANTRKSSGYCRPPFFINKNLLC